jgi:hypothetical protein
LMSKQFAKEDFIRLYEPTTEQGRSIKANLEQLFPNFQEYNKGVSHMQWLL